MDKKIQGSIILGGKNAIFKVVTGFNAYDLKKTNKLNNIIPPTSIQAH